MVGAIIANESNEWAWRGCVGVLKYYFFIFGCVHEIVRSWLEFGKADADSNNFGASAG